jgi:peptidoglycan/xylan/chitin deacetylase (PgdA/CDA1 family)
MSSLRDVPGPAARLLNRLLAGSAVVLLVAGCGLGDLPARSAEASDLPSSGPSTTPGPSPSPTSSPGPTAAPTPTPQPTPLVYVVKANDSLVNLGHRYRTTGRSIAYWNRKAYPTLDPDKPTYNPNHLEIGWRLTIYPGLIDNDGNGLADASPTPAPPIAPSIPPAVSPPADGSGLLVTRGAPGGNDVALTFNLDTSGLGLDIVSWLVQHGVHATVFVSGHLAGSDPTTNQVLQALGQHPDLFAIGNEANDGAALGSMSASQVSAQVTTADTAIQSASGLSSKPFFRPPFGTQNPTIRGAVASVGFNYTILWDVDTNDATPSAQGGPTAQDIVSRVLSRASGGSIVLLHLSGGHTLEALPGIIDGLNQAGLAPVTLAEMFGR